MTRMRYSLDVGEFDCFEVGSWADTAAAKANTPASTRMALVSFMTQPPFGARGARPFDATFVPKTRASSLSNGFENSFCQPCQDCFFFDFLLRIRPWIKLPRPIRARPGAQATAGATNGAPIRGFPSARSRATGVRRTGGLETREIDSPALGPPFRSRQLESEISNQYPGGLFPWKSVRLWYSSPTAVNVSSPKAGARSWSPVGSPSRPNPFGTDIAGCPRRLPIEIAEPIGETKLCGLPVARSGNALSKSTPIGKATVARLGVASRSNFS